MSICPESEYRSSLSDAEFWDRVFNGVDFDTEDNGPDLDLESELYKQPCTVCGSITHCGTDSDGRPMIHIEESEDD